jgi:hypothetical protein
MRRTADTKARALPHSSADSCSRNVLGAMTPGWRADSRGIDNSSAERDNRQPWATRVVQICLCNSRIGALSTRNPWRGNAPRVTPYFISEAFEK